MMAAAGGIVRYDRGRAYSRLHAEIVQTVNGFDHSLKRLGNRGPGGIGEVLPAVHHVMMNLGAKRALDCGGGPARRDPVPPASHGQDGEVLVLEPLNDPVNVV